MKPPIAIGGLEKSGKTAFICALLKLAEKKGIQAAAFKPFDKGLLKRNAIEMLSDGEKFCLHMKGEPMATLVSPYCANEDYPMEMSFRRDGIRINWNVLNERLAILDDLYQRTFIELPASLLTPLTENKTAFDWIKETGARIIWLFHPLHSQFIQNLFEIKLMNESRADYTIVFNNASLIMDQDLLFYTWEKTENFSNQEAAGMIPFIPALNEQYQKMGEKIEESLSGLLEEIFRVSRTT